MIILPWPDKALNPNSRTHWAVKAKATKAYRQAAGWAARASKHKCDIGGIINLHITFMPPDKRRRDMDNMIASCKGLLDGIADGLGVNDSRFALHIGIGEVRKGGQVLVTWG